MKSEQSEDVRKYLQKIFEFIVKNRGDSVAWQNNDIKRFIKWALYYRKLFIIWAPAGQSQRIAALGMAWRTERIEPQFNRELVFENTEFGNNLYIFQVIVHPDFIHTGTLFQLLSLACWRYPGCEKVFWNSEHHGANKLRALSTNRLLKFLSRPHAFSRIKKYERYLKPKTNISDNNKRSNESWAEEVQHPESPTLNFLR